MTKAELVGKIASEGGITKSEAEKAVDGFVSAVSDALALDRLLLVVANDPWQKSSSRAVTPAEDRFAMAQALADGMPGVEASRMEIDRGGPSYTVTTVEALRAEAAASGRPAPQIYLVIGADLLADLGTWERADDLREMVTLAVVSRPPTTAGTGRPDARASARSASTVVTV